MVCLEYSPVMQVGITILLVQPQHIRLEFRYHDGKKTHSVNFHNTTLRLREHAQIAQ